MGRTFKDNCTGLQAARTGREGLGCDVVVTKGSADRLGEFWPLVFLS